MKPARLLVFLPLFCILLLPACGRQERESEKITIAAAANTQFAMQKLAEQFTKDTGIDCRLIIGSSGKLTAQITEGAPYDVFVAANMKYPWEVYDSGFAEGSPKIYAYGKLVLWSLIDGIQPSVELLSNNSIQHIALANPKTAPYGEAAMEVLMHYNLQQEIENKLVYGESIAQTNQFIISKSAELGFTAMSTVLSPSMRGKGRWTELDKDIYTPIEQGVVVIKMANRGNGNGLKFYEFLFSEKAKGILKDFGYMVNE